MVKKNKDISLDVPDMNQSMIDHVFGVIPTSIKQNDCIRNGKECVYMNDCEYKDYFDSFLWNCLKCNITCSVEIKKCNNYSEQKEINVERIIL